MVEFCIDVNNLDERKKGQMVTQGYKTRAESGTLTQGHQKIIVKVSGIQGPCMYPLNPNLKPQILENIEIAQIKCKTEFYRIWTT